MGFFDGLRKISRASEERKKKKEQKAKSVNQNPSEEELKNNKKGKLSYLWTFISMVVYVLGFGLVFAACEENFGVGILAFIFVLSITPMAQTKAVNLAREQRRINGKGLLALILAYILPLSILVAGFLFFTLGGGLFNLG